MNNKMGFFSFLMMMFLTHYSLAESRVMTCAADYNIPEKPLLLQITHHNCLRCELSTFKSITAKIAIPTSSSNYVTQHYEHESTQNYRLTHYHFKKSKNSNTGNPLNFPENITVLHGSDKPLYLDFGNHTFTLDCQ